MRTSCIQSRIGGTRGTWVLISTILFLHYACFIYDSREHFCLASSFREIWPEKLPGNAASSASQPSKDIKRISLQRSHRERSASSLSDEMEKVLPWQHILASDTHLLPRQAQIGHPQPVASIPACAKPDVESILKHAFNVLVYNQQRYLLTRREEKTITPGAGQRGKKKRGGKEESREGQRDDDTEEDRTKIPSEEVLLPTDSEKYHQERLAEYIKMSILLMLTGRLNELAQLPGVSEWTHADVSTVNSDEDFVFLPVYYSSLSLSAAPSSWQRAYARLLSQLKGQLQENNELFSPEKPAWFNPLSHDIAVLRTLENNRQVEELAALLSKIGQAALPNEPEEASVYLSFLTADEESMDLWRSHIVRHVFERFTFAPCSPRKAAVTAEEGIAFKLEQKGRRESSSFFRLSPAPVESYIDSLPVDGLHTVREGGAEEKVEEKEAHLQGGGEEVIEEKKENGASSEANKNAVWRESLLNANWMSVHDLLLRELQQHFWMARPASSAAAVKMIQRARERQQQEKEGGERDGGQPVENHERGRMRKEEQQMQQKGEKHFEQNKKEQLKLGEKKEADEKKLLKESKRGSTSRVKTTNTPVEGKPWEAEVSIRFRFVSMKDAQRMMGTFLTSNLHPEMGFPIGTKLPLKSRSISTRGDAAERGAATENGAEDEEKTQDNADPRGPKADEAKRDEEDEEQQVPDYFDARHAFPACKDVIGHVRDQGSCGSCWAFSSTTSFNDRLCVKSGGDLKQLLSPQHTTSCCDAILCASYGCHGGEPGFAWRWFSRNGVVSGGDYDTLHTGKTCWPYELPFCNHHAKGPFPDCGKFQGLMETPVCRSECEEAEYTKNVRPFAQDLHHAARAYSFPTPMDAKKDIMRSGSISAAFMVYEDFLNYRSGVYKHVYGLPVGGHAVKAIGWGVEGGEEYWLLVNSWNTYWGENGLMKFKIGEAGINDDLLAGDVIWNPHADNVARDTKPVHASGFSAGTSNVHTYREL